MAWIESNQILGREPKLLRLSARLRVHKAQALGHLQYLWWWALDFARNGDISAFASAEISAASDWPGNAELFMKALTEVGWIENGKLYGWDKLSGKYFSSSDRQRRHRLVTLQSRDSYVTVTTSNAHKEKEKQEETKKEESSKEERSKEEVREKETKEKCVKEKFKKPTPEEASNYAKSIGFQNLDGEKFCAYYETRGWVVGKTPMKSWKAAIKTWKIYNFSPQGGVTNGNTRIVGSAGYEKDKYAHLRNPNSERVSAVQTAKETV